MKKWLIGVLLALVVVALIGWQCYRLVYVNNLQGQPGQTHVILVPTGSDYDQLLDKLADGHIINSESFRSLAAVMSLDEHINPGRYVFTNPASNYDLVWALRSGRQTPVKLTTRKARSKEEVAGWISQKLEADSLSILQLLNDEQKLGALGLNSTNVLSVFIPNTFEFYWNTSADKFLERMKKEYDAFWTETRLNHAKAKGLTPLQVIVLASIVEEESEIKAERPVIAGLYINRLNTNMKLQADPTVKFATQNFGARRVLYTDLEYNSPYNTYVYVGLPPGPICTPSINAIDAVLNAENHDYIYMCAKPNNEIGHVFAKTNAQHIENARKYRKWLNQRGIYR
jgi:UPF0755 protein